MQSKLLQGGHSPSMLSANDAMLLPWSQHCIDRTVLVHENILSSQADILHKFDMKSLSNLVMDQQLHFRRSVVCITLNHCLITKLYLNSLTFRRAWLKGQNTVSSLSKAAYTGAAAHELYSKSVILSGRHIFTKPRKNVYRSRATTVQPDEGIYLRRFAKKRNVYAFQREPPKAAAWNC